MHTTNSKLRQRFACIIFFSLVQNGQHFSIKEQPVSLSLSPRLHKETKLSSIHHQTILHFQLSHPKRTMNYANMNNSGMNHSNMNNAGMSHSNMNNNSGVQGQRTGAAGKGPDFICKSQSLLLQTTITGYQEANQNSSRQTRAQIRWPKIQRSRQ
jgi:hypothetical protein